MSGPVCPHCKGELADGEEVCSKCAKAATISPLEEEEKGIQGQDEGGEAPPSDKETGPENDPDGGDGSEEDMLKDLMAKVQNAQAELDDELGGGLEDLRKRVGGVVDVIDRLENLNEAPPGEEGEEEGVEPPSGDAPSGGEKPEDDAPRKDPDDKEDIPDAQLEGVEEVPVPEEAISDAVPMGHFEFPTESPYESMRITVEEDGDEYEGEDDLAYQTVDLDPITDNLIALIRMRRNEGQLQEAMELLEMASELSPNDKRISEEMKVLEAVLESEVGTGMISGEDITKTTVLAEELTETISQLEESAASTISQLERLIDTTDPSSEDIQQVEEKLKDAVLSFKEKRFHNSQKLAKEGIERIKEVIQKAMDASTQENIDTARDLMAELESSKRDEDQELFKSLEETFEEGVKAFLSEEFERSNLLSRDVIRRILDHRDPEAGEIKERIVGYRRDLSAQKDLAFLEDEIMDIESVLDIAEKMVKKRRYSDAKKLLVRIEGTVGEVQGKRELFLKAKEMRIKITNRFDRLRGVDDSIKGQEKKVKYFNMLFDKERFEDLISLGNEIEEAFDQVEETKQRADADSVMRSLGEVVKKAEELYEGLEYLSRYDQVKSRYERGEYSSILQEGRTLLNEMNIKLKTQFLERAQKVSSMSIESKLLLSKLEAMGSDPGDLSDELKKARNMIQGERYRQGIKLMEDVISRMGDMAAKRGEFLEGFLLIHHDSLEAIMDRYRDEPQMFLIRKNRVPFIKKLTDLGRYSKALDLYRELGSSFPKILTKGDMRKRIEKDMNQLKFDMYTRKDEGQDITEPLSFYKTAQKSFSDGSLIEAEYLTLLSRKYMDSLMGDGPTKIPV